LRLFELSGGRRKVLERDERTRIGVNAKHLKAPVFRYPASF